MGKKWYKHVTVPIYGTRISFFALMDDDKERRKRLASAYGIEVPPTWGAGVWNMTDGSVCFVIGDKSQYGTSTITHESVHAAWRTIDNIGAIVDSGNHEQLAYLAGWISEQATKFFSEAYTDE